MIRKVLLQVVVLCRAPSDKLIASAPINLKFVVSYMLCTKLRLISIANKLRLISTLYKTRPGA